MAMHVSISITVFTTITVHVRCQKCRKVQFNPSQTPNWHGHVTAVTCAPSHRRLGLAAKLMAALEEISEKKHCFFVDLFVRVSNSVAINMYKALGYTIYRQGFGLRTVLLMALKTTA